SVEEVTLILRAIPPPAKHRSAAGIAIDASIVAGRDVGRAELLGDGEEAAELDLLVAVDAGARGRAGAVRADEGIDHPLAERGALVEDVVGDAEVLTGAPRVVPILGRAAAPHLVLPLRVPEVQRDPDQIEALLGEQRRRDGGVDAAAH